ncbi:MAG TPA: cupin domain-containing protein [Actinomycetes bacterium]|nr:cupin domain-containing protein [Actinomycetes bacterium]
MPAGPAPYVGERLREERTRRGVSVRALARELGVSASLISQIETGKSQPSVSTLYAITTALRISVEDVFGPSRATDDGVAQATLDALGPQRGQRVGPVVTPGQRQVLQLDSGVTWERLGQLQHPHVDFLLITYEPGGTSSSNGGLMRHGGCEYGHLMSGSLILTLGFEDHVLSAGDSVSFESSIPHRYRNDGPEPAVGVWFVTES